MHPVVGQPFPEFELPDAEGKLVRLSELRGAPVVLYFYPADDTPGCTREACSFRDQYEDFQEVGAVVLGVSGDSPRRHRAFSKKHNLPFRLLCDEGGVVAQSLGIKKLLGLLPGRVTFIISKEGILLHKFDNQFQATKHVSESLKIIKESG